MIKRSSQKRSSLTEVAALAGVSSATVDRVLNGRGGVREELETKVLNAARKLRINRNLDQLPRQTLRFSVLMNRPDRDIYARIQRAILDHQSLHDNKGFTCSFHYFSSQEPKDIASRIESIQRGFDGVILLAYDHPIISDALNPICREVPVVTLISDLPNSGRTYYAGSGNKQAGKLAGDLIGRFIPESIGRVLILTRLQRYTAHLDREVGLRQVVAERYPRLSASDVLECNHGDAKDFKKASDFIAENGPFSGVYNISSWNIPMIQKLKDEKVLQDTVIVAHGVNRRTRALLRDGVLDAVIEYSPEDYAKRAVDTLLNHFGRCDDFDQNYRHRLEVFTREYLPPVLEVD